MAIKSTYFMHDESTWHSPDGRTRNQIDHCLIDGRHFSDVIDVKAQRRANIDSDHMLVVIKLRYTISRASNTTPQQLRRFAVERLNDGNVATMYRHELEAELLGASEPKQLCLNDKWRRMEEAVRKVATNTIGYTRKRARKVWFDEECEKVNEEKNACRANAIHRVTRATQDKYRQARTIERNLFKEKSRQLDEEALIEIERHRNIQNSCNFYKRLNDVKWPFEARAKNGELLTKKDQVLSRWKEHFEQHLNKREERDQPPDQVDLRVDIDLPSREEIESALKYLKNYKAAGADSIAAELLKNGGP
jgi:hypothetical protein